MTDHILPCPFCGGVAQIEEIPASPGKTDGVRFSVGCASDEDGACMGYQSLTTFNRRSEAITAWNKRAPINDNAIWNAAIEAAASCAIEHGDRLEIHSSRISAFIRNLARLTPVVAPLCPEKDDGLSKTGT